MKDTHDMSEAPTEPHLWRPITDDSADHQFPGPSLKILEARSPLSQLKYLTDLTSVVGP